MRILIAEDDEALAKFVQQGLETEHYRVDIFRDGEQARAAATEAEYDLVILDLNLPKLDGISGLRHLRVKKPNVPVLVLTQRTKVEDRVQSLDSGTDDYLGKPFSCSELSARIRALIRRSQSPAVGISTDRRRPQARPYATAGRTRGVKERADCQGIRVARVTDAAYGARCNPLDDHRKRMESHVRYHDECGRCLHQVTWPANYAACC